MKCIDNSVVEGVCAYVLWPLYVKVSRSICMYKLRKCCVWEFEAVWSSTSVLCTLCTYVGVSSMYMPSFVMMHM